MATENGSSEEKTVINKANELFRYIEVFFLGIIILIGRYFKTFWDFLFKPAKILYLKNSSGDTIEDGDHMRPLTFLFINVTVFLLSYLGVINYIDEKNLIPENSENIFEKILLLFKNLSSEIKDFNSENILILLIPFVLFVAIYSKIQNKISYIFKLEVPFKSQLVINSYTIGTLTFLLSTISSIILMFLCADKITFSTFQETVILLVIFVLPTLMILLIYRYFVLSKAIQLSSWWKTFFSIIISMTVCILLIIAILAFIPFTANILSGKG